MFSHLTVLYCNRGSTPDEFPSYMANIASTLFPFKTPIKTPSKSYIYRCQFLILLHMCGQLLYKADFAYVFRYIM